MRSIVVKLFAVLFVAVIMSVVLFVTGCNSTSDSTNTAAPKVSATGKTQTVPLTVDSNYNYAPKEIIVAAGTLLRIEADPKTNIGGMDTVIIEGYNIRKKISPQDNVLEFVADTPGTFKIYCANRMGNGKLIVQ